MKKLPSNLENPIDNIFYNYITNNISIYYQLGWTPNILTSLSLIFGIFSGIFLYNEYKISSIICHFIAYYYDCADGAFARAYNMETNFGDFYDHFSDYFKFFILYYTMYTLDIIKFYFYLPYITILTFLMAIHLGCQEKFYNNHKKSKILSIWTYFSRDKNNIKYTRYFGCGTYITFIAILIYLY